MRRAYVNVSHFRSPYASPNLSLAGLGASVWSNYNMPLNWPVGRSYVDVAHFRAPYDQGYFQDNSLFGVGAEAAAAPPAPSDVLGSTLTLIGVGALVGAAGAYLVFRGRKQGA